MSEAKKSIKNIVVIGGGTGSFTVLSGLKKYPHNLTAIVSMADDGGSTGELRDQLGVLPPGDIRQCLVALSEGDLMLRRAFNHRYGPKDGPFDGHSFGNLFISLFEQLTGNFDKALEAIHKILKLKGRVVPVTLDKVQLRAKLNNGVELEGEHQINISWLLSKFGIKKLFLNPQAKANPKALKAIVEADAIVIGPGNLYCSIIPNFLVEDISEAVQNSKAIKIYNCNLMTKYGHTDNFKVSDFVRVIEWYLGKGALDYITYSITKPLSAHLKEYSSEGEWVKLNGKHTEDKRYIGADLVSPKLYKQDPADKIKRTLIRHDPDKLAEVIISLLNNQGLALNS